MGKFQDLTGKRNGKIFIESFSHFHGKHNRAVWNYECDCGSKGTINTSEFNRKSRSKSNILSCGCSYTYALDQAKVYQEKERLKWIWADMKSRCNNPNHPGYKNYGGRGIKVSDEWQLFENFYKDMNCRPLSTSLDRIDNNRGYSKDNCRWVDRKIQNNNKRSCKIVTYKGEKLNLKQCWEKYQDKSDCGYTAFVKRYHRGYPIHQCLFGVDSDE